MKTQSCKQNKPEPKKLAWGEIILNEGVYQPTTGGPSVYLIVIGTKPTFYTALFYNRHTQMLLPAAGWEDHKFIKVDKEVCLELRDKI